MVIEDDARLGAQIVGHLTDAGFDVVWWTEGRAPSASVLASIHLIILDLMLP